jgi:tetratricopeptide (TPR) repeat protein
MAVAVAEAATVPMSSRLMVALLVVLVSTPRAGVARAQSLTDANVSDTARAESPERWFALGHELYDAARFRESIAAFERGLQLRADGASDGAWHIARAYAQLDNRKQALRWLTHARQLGFRNEQAIRAEPAFDKYRDDARFRELVSPSACQFCPVVPQRRTTST